MSEDLIHDLISDGQSVSAKWLALHCSFSIDVAKALMLKYKSNHDEVKAKYVISGKNKSSDNEFSIILVNDDGLEEKKSLFEDSNYLVEIYSLHSSHSSVSDQNLVLSNNAQTSEFLGSSDKSEKFINRSLIKAQNLILRPVGQRITAATELFRLDGGSSKGLLFTGGSSKDKTKVATTVQNFFGQPKDSKPSDSSKPPLHASNKEQSKGIVSAIKDPLKHSLRGNDGSASESEQDVIASNISAVVEDALEDDEEEWDDGSGIKMSKKDSNKRTINDEEEEQEILNTTLTKEDELLIAKQTGSDKSAHGAMDNFVSEIATSSAIKKKKKKLVEKTFLDAKGYMVTEMVTEEVTDDEPSPKKSISTIKPPNTLNFAGSNSNNNLDKAKNVPSSKKPNTGSTTQTQKGISSFFSKKA